MPNNNEDDDAHLLGSNDFESSHAVCSCEYVKCDSFPIVKLEERLHSHCVIQANVMYCIGRLSMTEIDLAGWKLLFLRFASVNSID